MTKRALWATTSLCVLALTIPTIGTAQESQNTSTDLPEVASEKSYLEVITVTSSRRAESIQDTGSSVSALSSQGIENKGVQSVEDVADLVPGLQVASYQGDTSIYIRGIGTPVIVAGADSSTATYLNGVYLSRAAAIGPGFFDVERLEVLRGPQGTLYGRNATGGAVNIITKRPTEEFSGEARLVYGDYNRIQAFGALSGSITDGVRARIAAEYEDRDGYTTVHRADGSSYDAEDQNYLTMRLTVEADITPDVMLTLTGDYYSADDKANVFHFASLGYQDEVDGWLNTREGSQTIPYFAIKNSGNITETESRDIFSSIDHFNDTSVWGVSGKLDWAIGDYDLSVIAGYKKTDPEFQNSFDLGDTYNTYILRAEDHEQSNIDFQLTSPASDRFSWILGGGYFTEENNIQNNIFGDFWEPILIQGFSDLQAAGVLPPFPIDIPSTELCCELHLNGQQTSDAFNLYFDTSFDMTDTLTLKAGVRYSEEERDGYQAFDLAFLPATAGGDLVRFAPNTIFFPNAISEDRDVVQPDPFGFNVGPVNGPTTFDAVTPKVALEWTPADDILLYVSAQRGFKSGGYNIGSSQRDAFEPEKIWSYEAGWKTSLLENRLMVNGAAFLYDYSNLQSQDSIGNQPIIRNVGKAEVTGIEVEYAALLSDSFRLDGSMTYLNAEFTEGALTEALRPAPLTQAPGSLLVDLAGKNLPRAPEFKVNFGAQSDLRVGNGDLMLRADYTWQDKVYFTVFNIEAASQDSYGVLRARASYSPDDKPYKFSVFGQNLTDETYFTNQILTGTTYGAEFVGSLGAPRTFGIEFSTAF
ncbi:TonB-dependent receptor [Hirschia baltica]|uniref:TonB-dependent receptor n=1 Tax=Hirschia baltica (strain ATCC 49814 / DSM 5838 / IFAM 1418) TaxID=582402 RepID=C6XNX4_HIRBI|nr:TonB-dependent receptor [Hirschia baltica]ACT60154.1 TonB-dependent receptor [Hirschia baltica ATCC 49814]